MEHNPRASHVVFGGGEEAVFSQGHIADERQYEHGDAQDNQAQGLGGADHFGGAFALPCVRVAAARSRPMLSSAAPRAAVGRDKRKTQRRSSAHAIG